MTPISQEGDLNPYQPPVAASVEEVPMGSVILKDPRLLGWCTLTAISIQCVLIIVRAFVPISLKSMSSVKSLDLRQSLNTCVIVALLASVILYFTWLHRVATNVARIDRRSDVRAGWCIGCHFIPIANWVLPCQNMRKIIHGSFVGQPVSGLQGLAIVWWVSFQIRGITSFVQFGELASVIWLLPTVISWIGVCILVTRISQRQFEFRWTDLPESRRLNLLTRPIQFARSPGQSPGDKSLPPRRVPHRPIPVSEQHRLIREIEASENPGPSRGPETG